MTAHPPALLRSTLVLAIFVGGACGSNDEAAETPYAGLQEREIAALSPEQVGDLVTGEGAGFALAAELNHYPGPKHVLDLASELALDEQQLQATRGIRAAMLERATDLGVELVRLEEELDQLFGSATASSEQVAQLTREIALVEGRLRNVHLRAHIQMRQLLTPEQRMSYDRLRGYTGDGSETHEHDEGDHHD